MNARIFVGALTLLIGSVGCTTVQHIEELTPAGAVAPETVAAPPPYQTIRETTKLREYKSARTASAKTAAKTTGKALGYAGQTTLVNIRGASASPQKVRRGDAVTVKMEYTILAPANVKSLDVSEVWLLEKDGTEVTRTEPRKETREPGGWQSQASIPVPADAPLGTYVIKSRVESSAGPQETVAYFVVE